MYDRAGRRPWSSINFVTAHDGFTLHDLVSYNHKHNEANGEDNRDGADDNHSWNCGAEGPTDDPDVHALRARQKRNMLGTLLLSHGTPMLLAGDEHGNTQGGNNNVYCQDNEISWINWDAIDDEGRALTDFVRRAIQLRQAEPLLHRHSFRDGMIIRWLGPSGNELAQDAWHDPETRSAGLLLSRGQEAAYGNKPSLGRLLLLFNAHHEDVDFKLPDPNGTTGWKVLLDTASDEPPSEQRSRGGESMRVLGRSIIVLGLEEPTEVADNGGD
jgi:isoamylase